MHLMRQLLQRIGLRQEIPDTRLLHGIRLLRARMAAGQEDAHGWLQPLQRAAERRTIHQGQLHVGDHQIDLIETAGIDCQCLTAILSSEHRVAQILQAARIVDRTTRVSSATSTRLPLPSGLCAKGVAEPATSSLESAAGKNDSRSFLHPADSRAS